MAERPFRFTYYLGKVGNLEVLINLLDATNVDYELREKTCKYPPSDFYELFSPIGEGNLVQLVNKTHHLWKG